jgi:integrase
MLRRTVAALMDEAGLSAQAADQLDHAKVSMTQDQMLRPEAGPGGAAKLLESVDQAPAEEH